MSAPLRRSNSPPILPLGEPTLRYIFRARKTSGDQNRQLRPDLPPPLLTPDSSQRPMLSRPSTSRSRQGTWSVTTAAANDFSEHLLIRPSGNGQAIRFAGSSPTLLPSQDIAVRWDFEYWGDNESWEDDEEMSATQGKPPRVSRINTQNVTRKFGLRPAMGLIVSPEEIEKDDALHDPGVGGDGDGQSHTSIRNRRGLINVVGTAMVIVGVIMLLVGLPILSQIEEVEQVWTACEADPDCIRADLPLLRNVRSGPIDPDSPASAMSRKDINGNTQALVFSDEFDKDGRTFYPGDDPYFQGEDFWYGVTQDLEWYDPDAISTANGTLNIRFDAYENHNLSFRSGLLQSWNKLCFKGGYVEASISLPGSSDVAGLWPGFWAMGNLGRAGYAATTDGMWPYTYWDECDAGIAPNQSSSSGLSWLPGMRLPACTCNASDTSLHPTPGKSRSAPELDILEGNIGFLGPDMTKPIGTGSQSLQVAPFDPGLVPNYSHILNFDPALTHANPFLGSNLQESISYISLLNSTSYNGHAYTTFSLEYEPGAHGYATFFINGVPTWHIDAAAIGPVGNIGQRVIPTEPMALITNLGMSPTFAVIDMAKLHEWLPATMRVDYIRIYQGEGHWFGCDPPGYETTGYVEEHPRAYRDWNRTTWRESGYEWPRNDWVDGCEEGG